MIGVHRVEVLLGGFRDSIFLHNFLVIGDAFLQFQPGDALHPVSVAGVHEGVLYLGHVARLQSSRGRGEEAGETDEKDKLEHDLTEAVLCFAGNTEGFYQN